LVLLVGVVFGRTLVAVIGAILLLVFAMLLVFTIGMWFVWFALASMIITMVALKIELASDGAPVAGMA
jgi:hypothetical protein